MRTSRRLLACVTATLILVLMVTCWNGVAVAATGEAGNITVRLAWPGSGQNKERIDDCLKQYTDATGVEIDLVFIPGNWAEYFTKIQTMIAGGEKLDACRVAIEGFEMLVKTGMAAPIDDWIAANGALYNAVVDDIDDNIIQIMNFGGHQYGVPGEWNNVVTHINTKLLEEAGLELPAPDWDKDEFLRYAQALTKQRDDGTMQYGCYIPGGYFLLEAFMYNNDTAFMSDDFTKSTLLDPNTVEMFQFIYDLIYEYKVAPIPEEGADDIQLLIDGNIGMFFAGRWPTSAYINNDFDDVAIQYIPTFKTNTPIWGGAGVFALKDSENLDAAIALSVHLASAPFVEQYLETGPIPVLNSVAKKVLPELGIPKNNSVFFESAPLAKAVQSPKQYAECSSLIERLASDIFVNQKDILASLTAADAELNMILMDN